MRSRPVERRLPHRSEAFTLIELMIAIVIVGIMVMTVAPSLQQVLGDNRQSSAAGDLVRIGRRARALAIASGAAHMLRFTEAGPSGSNLGLIELYVGMNNKCLQTPWVSVLSSPMVDSPVSTRVGVFDMTEYNPTNGSTQPTAGDSGRQVITLRARTINPDTSAVTVRQALRICFQPNGDVYTTTADNSALLAMQRDRVQFTIARNIGGTSYGRARQVLFPVAGSMRFE